MPDKIHGAVQDAGHLHVLLCEAVKNDMLPSSHMTVRRDVVLAHEWVVLNGRQRLVQDGRIRINLPRSPHLQGVGKNIPKIFYGRIGKAEAVGFTG